MHTVSSSNPQSRTASPPPPSADTVGETKMLPPSHSGDNLSPKAQIKTGIGNSKLDSKQLSKHTLLATAANQNYQRCHRALENLEHYWAGTKYILTVLDQKAKGVYEPVLYTKEEMECALETPSREPAFTSPGWRRKTSWESYFSDSQISTQPWGPVRGSSQLPSNMMGNSPKLPNVNVDMNSGTSSFAHFFVLYRSVLS